MDVRAQNEMVATIETMDQFIEKYRAEHNPFFKPRQKYNEQKSNTSSPVHNSLERINENITDKITISPNSKLRRSTIQQEKRLLKP